jgi:hypothetical protein
MDTIIKNYLEQAKIGRKQTYKNLTIFPLLSTYFLDLDYLLLDEALVGGLIEVVEVDQEGSVPELKVINKSPRMVLILDGEELVGAKQNRIVNTSILIQGNYGLRAMKSEQVNYSVRVSGEYRSDQGAIWNEISEKAARREAASPSMAMASIYEKDMPSIQEYVSHFHLIDSQVGAVFMINDKVVGMDGFGNSDSFSKVFKKLVKSYALDAIDWFDPEKEYKGLKGEVTKFMKASRAARIESHESVGLGVDYRMESRKITGFSLAFDNQILHMSVFARTDDQNRRMQTSRMERYTQRRRNRV